MVVVSANEPTPSVSKKSVTTPIATCKSVGGPASTAGSALRPASRACLKCHAQKAMKQRATTASGTRSRALGLKRAALIERLCPRVDAVA
jgi:hypothetical protein